MTLLQRIKKTLVSADDGEGTRKALSRRLAQAGSRRERPAQRQGRAMTRRMKQLALVGVPVLVLAGALIAWLQGGRHISTENAFVKADIAQIASEVPGRIIEVRIQDHSAVAAGDVLVRLDPAPYKLALAKAEAEIDSARAAVEQLKASLTRDPGRGQGGGEQAGLSADPGQAPA